MSCENCRTVCFVCTCNQRNGETPMTAETKLKQVINLFREHHMQLDELIAVKMLTEEMPNWDEIVPQKFILYCVNEGVFTSKEIEAGACILVRQPNGHHVIKVGTTYIDWASKKHSPSVPWPMMWEAEMS